MEMYNDKIEPGALAMIIGTFQPKNSHLIGRVVLVEDIIPGGADLGYLLEPYDIYVAATELVLISGLSGQTVTHRYSRMAEGVAVIDPKHLMPLPPLKEEVKAYQKEVEFS